MLNYSFFSIINVMNEFVMPQNLEIGVLHIIVPFLVQQIWHFMCYWQPFWIPAAILNIGLGQYGSRVIDWTIVSSFMLAKMPNSATKFHKSAGLKFVTGKGYFLAAILKYENYIITKPTATQLFRSIMWCFVWNLEK